MKKIKKTLTNANATEAEKAFRVALAVTAHGLSALMLTVRVLDDLGDTISTRWPTAVTTFYDLPLLSCLDIREGTPAVKFLKAAILAHPAARSTESDKVFALIQSAEKSAISAAANLRGKD